MEGSLLEAFVVRLFIVDEGTEVQISTATAFAEVFNGVRGATGSGVNEGKGH